MKRLFSPTLLALSSFLIISCTPPIIPDLADIQGDHVHREEVDIYFGDPVEVIGSEEESACIYHYSGEILFSEGGKAYPKGDYILRARYSQDHLMKYMIEKRK